MDLLVDSRLLNYMEYYALRSQDGYPEAHMEAYYFMLWYHNGPHY